ncbi:type II toxin-antitoxin system ParD family antitoxin [Rhizobium sp. CG5]|uniref:type II toxin-antitoxin system ParD family antitoxin n=1 Tax=Rhizobium sp. CG5 TaxID=2726076 RepID=UPI0020348A2E|nr:type II toxin-antitoxin system ParD family antitoxin [Rhizobium sp. CG5]MCM2474921.1 type II toxin-antitoxin system ParD family antitoxin [Rhizobium sp. CG5]
MAKTALNLGPHWEDFIEAQVTSGRYASAEEVVRDALQGLEKQTQQLDELRRLVNEGISQADAGEFVDNFSIEDLIDRLDAER